VGKEPIDCHRSVCYNVLDIACHFAEKEVLTDEEDVSAQQARSQEGAWIPAEDAQR
jgi:hypothetical protein